MTRAKILEKAKDIVNGQRDEMYGSPENSFSAIAMLWDSYFAARDIANVVTPDSDFFVGRISEYDVAMLMILLKIARSMKNPDNPDHYIDMAGYAACVGEIYTQPFAEQDAEECVTDNTEFKIDDKVVFISEEEHATDPCYYPACGTVGNIVGFGESSLLVQWPAGSTSDDDTWYCDKTYVRKAEE